MSLRVACGEVAAAVMGSRTGSALPTELPEPAGSGRDSNPRPLRCRREPAPFRPAATSRNARAGFEPAFPSFLRLVRTAAPPPRCVPGRSMAGRYVFPSLRRAVCAARPPFGPGSARSFAPSCVEGCWSPALDPHGFTVDYSAMRGRRQLHCRKIAQDVGGEGLSLLGGASVSLSGDSRWRYLRLVGFGQQKGRPGGSPSRIFGGYALCRLAHGPPCEGGGVVAAVRNGPEDGQLEARAARAARHDGRDGCRACEPLGCRRVESHDVQFGVGE